MNDLLSKTLPDLLRDLPGFRLFAICIFVLAIKMYVLGGMTAFTRARLKVFLNPEDARGLDTANAEHPDVSRYLRAHRNDLESIPLFFTLGLVAVLIGAPLLGMQICFIVFTVARLLHTVVYLRSLQPWRTLSFAIGTTCNTALGVMILIRVFS
ncbi:MAG: MAPEG family protein [Hyalangium sp.]|uniref:MAPEG family protein n=1 Tax=Hyalangium sp. TaxID=2028555 RepID=UPI003899B076